ncbi:YchJ family protein [Granulicoccus phenolivorans]|uniref:YchJ family protein n=1 Tax=Granulicoccus phenolivorans TaxID=266854 RepID=UPI000684F0EE|nr:YchJ family metal-binding protein [Granulicoccus phenolivorans]
MRWDGPVLNFSGAQPCPCGSGATFAACCRVLLNGERQAATAEELMRSRYTAYALQYGDYLFRTWHPRTRPAEVLPAPMAWTGLIILDVVDGGPEDEMGEVEFEAGYLDGDRPTVLRERSRFARRAGRWFYLNADTLSVD